ncbi:MAG: hypothetical protein QJR05_10600 [Thermoanaerobacterium sp.]|nr:hypothetical protein [Thermoanaerobacterium sp.]
MNQNLWNVIQTLLETESIGSAELALAKESLGPEVFSSLVEYMENGLTGKGETWV